MKKNLLAGAALLIAAGVVQAQDFPSRAITVVVPNPPGGMNQITANPLATVMEKMVNQPVVVVNKPGGTAAVGTAFVANQKPDGHHILVTTPNIYLVVEKNKLYGEESPYKLEQIAPIALTSADPLVLTVQAGSPIKSVKDFIATVKSRQGEMSFSSSGPWGVTHVPMEAFLASNGLKMRHVPTTGGGPAVTAILGGHVDVTNQGLAAVAPHVKSGKLRALATFGAKRSAQWPDVPTLREMGQDAEGYLWVGLFTTNGTPQPVMNRLRDLVKRTMNDPVYMKAMENAAVDIEYLDTPEFVKFFETDYKRMAAAVKRIGRIDEKK